MYILFEGIDTSGKSTQAKLLHDAINNSILTKEPGGTKIGSRIREMVLHETIQSHKAELFLFLADRAEHYKEIIEPNKSRVIISDRGLISGIAYALTNEKYDLDFLIQLNLFALSNTLPDKVIFLEISKKTLLERMQIKEEDKIEQRGLEYLLRVQENIKKVLDTLALDHIIIDSSLKIDDIFTKIKDFIDD